MKRFHDLADALDEIALHLRLEGNTYQANQYRKASESLRKAEFLPSDPSDIPNIGPSIRDDIAEYRAFGEIERLEDMREKRPYLSNLVEVDNVGPKRAQALHKGADISTVDDIIEVCDNGDLTTVSGIGEATSEKICRSARRVKYQ